MQYSTSLNASALGVALLRISMGAICVAHALLKILVFTPAGTAQFFASLGLPGALAYPVIAAELFGGLLLLAGVYARQVSGLLIPVMAGATWAHLGNGWVHTNTGGGWEYPAFLTLSCLVLWLLDDSRYSLKHSKRWVL